MRVSPVQELDYYLFTLPFSMGEFNSLWLSDELWNVKEQMFAEFMGWV